MAETIQSSSGPDSSRAASPLPTQEGVRSSTLRLAISVPALLVLLTVGYGVVSYMLILWKWPAFEAQRLDDAAADLLMGHIIAMIVIVLVAVFGGLSIVYTVLRPIRAIESTARSIVEGRLNERAPTLRSQNELGSLSRSFNGMIDFLNDCIEDRNRYMVEGIMTGVLLVDLDGKIRALNITGARLLDLDASWAIGRSVFELPGKSGHAADSFWQELEKALRCDPENMEDDILLNASAGDAALIVAMSVLRDSENVPFALMLNFRDAGEIQSLNEQLSRTDQLAALGTFTMGLAHELRNPLGSIKGMIQLLRLEVPEKGDSHEIMDRVVGEVNRLDVFVRELLDFSQDQPSPPTELDLANILETSLAQVETQFSRDSETATRVETDIEALPKCLGESERLVQAFSNILRNAFEATPPGGSIRVEARTSVNGNRRSIEVHIRNTGSTIKANDMARIFDPFFSTKQRGTGLGLAIAYQILTQNGASVDVEAGPDEVDFIVTFPVETSDALEAASVTVPDEADTSLESEGRSSS